MRALGNRGMAERAQAWRSYRPATVENGHAPRQARDLLQRDRLAGGRGCHDGGTSGAGRAARGAVGRRGMARSARSDSSEAIAPTNPPSLRQAVRWITHVGGVPGTSGRWRTRECGAVARRSAPARHCREVSHDASGSFRCPRSQPPRFGLNVLGNGMPVGRGVGGEEGSVATPRRKARRREGLPVGVAALTLFRQSVFLEP